MKRLISLVLLLNVTILNASHRPPQLVVQIVVDQLRGDLIYHYPLKLSAKGFNYLFAHGINYQNAHHSHANTVTCAGHATIATGSTPSLHGIVANDWFDLETKRSIYCVEDKKSPILTTARSIKPSEGRSPRNLAASTLSDELVLAQRGRAFAVSLKDRAAITLAGHAGKAFWFDKENGGFVSSQHYYQTYPLWVNQWNQHYEAKDVTWALTNPVTQYRFAQAPSFTHRFPAFSQHFPHQLGLPSSPQFYKFFSMTPYADELTADFAIKLLGEEKLGQSLGKTDYLGVSFSAVDAIGHQFGPNSLESEDNLLRLDQTLSKLLTAIDQQVGLENTLIVLTADHGVSDSLAYLATQKINENQLLNTSKLEKIIITKLNKRFQLPAEALQFIALPYVYLNHQLINQQNLTVHEVSTYLADNLHQYPGIFQAYALPLSGGLNNWLSAKVDKMAFPGRAGDLYLVPPPYQTIAEEAEHRVSHGSPWNYDSYVPLLFVSKNFRPQHINRLVQTTDIAPTLAMLLFIKAPSASVGHPLQEVISSFEQMPEKK